MFPISKPETEQKEEKFQPELRKNFCREKMVSGKFHSQVSEGRYNQLTSSSVWHDLNVVVTVKLLFLKFWYYYIILQQSTKMFPSFYSEYMLIANNSGKEKIYYIEDERLNTLLFFINI